MRIFTYEKAGKPALGLLKSEQEYIDLGLAGYPYSSDMTELLAQPDWQEKLATILSSAPTNAIAPLSGVKYDILIPEPKENSLRWTQLC
jgi:hypothetical protein